MTMILTKLLRKKHGRPRPSAPPSVARSFPLPSFSSASCLMTSFSQRLACFPASLVKAPLSRPSSSLIRNTIWRGVATAVERPAEFSFSSPSSLFFLPQPLLPRGKDANFCSYPPSFAATGQKSCSRSPRDANPFGACATRSGEGRKRRGIGSRLVHDGSSLQETRRFYHQHTSLRSHPATTRGRKVERDLSTATAPTDEEEEEERQNSLASTAGGGGGGGLGQRKEQESLRGALKGERGPTDKLKKERDEEEVSASADVEYQRAADALLKNLFAQVEQSDFEGLDDIDYQVWTNTSLGLVCFFLLFRFVFPSLVLCNERVPSRGTNTRPYRRFLVTQSHSSILVPHTYLWIVRTRARLLSLPFFVGTSVCGIEESEKYEEGAGDEGVEEKKLQELLRYRQEFCCDELTRRLLCEVRVVLYIHSGVSR